MTCLNIVISLLFGSILHLGSTTYTVHPDNLTAVLGVNTSFHCSTSSRSRGIAWLITFPTAERVLDSSNNDDMPQFDERGFKIEESASRQESTLIIPAVVENNNTDIQCRIIGRVPTTFSYSGSLRILGPPSRPEPHLTVVNSSSLKVEWFTPFSWTNHSVTHYDITIENSKSEVQMMTTNETEFFLLESDPDGKKCDLLVINVTAISDIGHSDVGSISGGLPIAPGPIEFIECSDECKVTFLSDGTPQVKAMFKLPHICSYQAGRYEVSIIEEEFPENGTQVMSGNYTERDVQLPVSVVVTSGLKINRTYTMVATVSSCQGNSSNSFSFSTDFTLLNLQDTRQDTGANGLSTEISIAIGVAAGVLVLVILIITVLVIVLKKRKASKTDNEVSLDDMLKKRKREKGEHYTQPDSNRTYETIDGYQSDDFKHFVHVSSPNTSPTVPPRSSLQFRLSYPNKNAQPFNANVAVLPHSQQAPERVNVSGDDVEPESAAYLQLLSHGTSSESCTADPAVTNEAKRNSGGSNDEYTTMNSVGSLRNKQSCLPSAVNKLAISTFNEDNYMVFIEP